MIAEKGVFTRALSRETTRKIPLYCPGYPESQFIKKYLKTYKPKLDSNKKSKLIGRDYNIIKQIGFDAISIWDFRRGKGGYKLSNKLKVDSWGRIYRNNWYSWDGIFKDEQTIENWNHLKLPSKYKIKTLKNFLQKNETKLDLVLSIPGLFEKTWQSMGFSFFAKCLKSDYKFIEKVLSFFFTYIKDLISLLQSVGAKLFIVADDIGYKNRQFIPKDLWKKLFFFKYKDITNSIHENNHKIIIHSDGYISEMIDLFINIGFDAVQSLEPNAGVDIFSLFEKFNGNICFIGNLDISLLSFGTPQQVEDYVTKLINKSRETISPLIISPTQQIHSKINPRNIETMIETTKKFTYKI
jgi:uroporphyrinogen decarboxylase